MPPQTVQIFWIKFDPQQYYSILQSLHDIKEMIATLSDTSSGSEQDRIQAVTQKLKQSAETLQAAVEATKEVAATPPKTK